jgi:hypothetical protein
MRRLRSTEPDPVVEYLRLPDEGQRERQRVEGPVAPIWHPWRLGLVPGRPSC